MSKRRGTGIGSRAIRGAVAGAVGTAAMDLVWYRRYRRGGGKDPFLRWEFGGDVLGWADASAPGQLGRKVERIVTGRRPPERWARTTTNVMHWATGIGWAVQYGVLAGRPARHRIIRALALGPVVWLSGYVILPLADVYQPIWEYDARTLANDLSAHLVFGLTTSATYAALARQRT
ncbi:hypothetical protein BJF90_07985 [Pseudonocardia sp. CNS-004]|nr:hypothetical protein BJF90_07985 [Pseudonocardia sp. CNS-004]